MMTIEEIVAKRKRIWELNHDAKYDAEYVESAVDYILAHNELKKSVYDKPYLLIELAFTIVDKDGRTVPFFLNEVQSDFIWQLEHNPENKHVFVLKGRQQGITSLVTAIQLSFAIVRKNFSGATIANSAENVGKIFNDKAKAVYDRLPAKLHQHEKFNNTREYYFDQLNSSWRVAVATNTVGRSMTLQFCHFSELAFFECSIGTMQTSIGQALTKKAIVVYETTANGFNEAKDLWDKGTCINLFYEWWRTKEYTSDNLSVLDDISDQWLLNRVEWLQNKGLSLGQIAWYVDKFNSFLDSRQIRQEYPCFAEEAFLTSGECEFGNEVVSERLNAVKDFKPSRRGRFEYKQTIDAEGDTVEISDIKWIDDSNGEITIHSEPEQNEKKGKKPYAIGGDTAGEGSDYFTAKVVDNITGETVATYRKQKTDDDLYADQLHCLGLMYHTAIIGVEVNFDITATRRLVRTCYPRLYVRERLDSFSNTIEKAYGFKTTSITKPNIIAELKAKWRDSKGDIECDVETLKEMLTFVKDDKGRYGATPGKHDDLVMALAIAHHVGQQGDHEWLDPPPKKKSFDYFGLELHDDDRTAAEEYISWE